MNRPPTPDEGDGPDKEPTIQEVINIKVSPFSSSILVFGGKFTDWVLS